jgi:hypothetical protein
VINLGKNKGPLSIFITDNGVAIFGGNIKKQLDNSFYGQKNLPVGTIDNGYIKEPEILLSNLKDMWKEFKIKPKFVRLVIQDQNVLIREFQVTKKELEKKTIEEYFDNQIGKKFHVPFEKPTISYQIKSENQKELSILLYIADENLLQDYYDVMERLGIKDIVFDLAISALLEIADEDYDLHDENTMIVSLYDKLLSIQIIEKNKLIFGAIEECEGKKEQFMELTSTYIERIANYYQYNLRKGKAKITKTLVFNLNDYLDNLEIKQMLLSDLKHLNIKLYSTVEIDQVFKELPKGSLVAFASNQILLKRQKDKKIIDFKLNRINRLRLIGYYVFVLALAILAGISMLYITYSQNRDLILDQTYHNEALDYQISLLQIEPDGSSVEIDQTLKNAYELISAYQENLPTELYLDLTSILPINIEITDYTFNVRDQEITIIISGENTNDLLNYILDIYEEYGIVDSVDDQSRWITLTPSYNFISDTVCEVIIHYA